MPVDRRGPRRNAALAWTAGRRVPGEIVVVTPKQRRRTTGSECLSGEVESVPLDVTALGLTPLKLESGGMAEPDKHSWGGEGERFEKWAQQPTIPRGLRPESEMEHVSPGGDSADPYPGPHQRVC